MKRILVIDDDEAVLESLKLTFAEAFPDIKFEFEPNFDTGVQKVSSLRPDAVVLDLRKEPVPSNLPGQLAWQAIWASRFCPVVVYTAGDGDIDPPIPNNHPFVKLVIKTRVAEAQLVETLKGFIPCVEAIEKLRSELDLVIHQVLRDTAGKGVIDPTSRDHLLHAGRRRIAASMDDPTLTGRREMISWEQYLIPAIGNDPLTADLLMKLGGNKNDPADYRLLLTPSCDTARGGKVKTVLVAKCYPSKVMMDKLKSALKEKDVAKLQDHVMRLVLSQGVWNGWLPLPAFVGVVPGMVAFLKDLEVISLESIGCVDPAKLCFQRIASIDSPFREQVAWAYLTTSGRPGMPERELEPWAADCVGPAIPAAMPAAPIAIKVPEV